MSRNQNTPPATGSNPAGTAPDQSGSATSTFPGASGSEPASQTQRQPTENPEATSGIGAASKIFRGSKKEEPIEDDDDSEPVSVGESLRRGAENFRNLFTRSETVERVEKFDLDAWEKEELEFEKEIQRNLREGIKLPARDIPKRAESVAEYRKWIQDDEEKWAKIREERRQQSFRARLGRFYQAKKTQVLTSSVLLFRTFPTSGSQLVGKIGRVADDFASSFYGGIQSIESSIIKRFHRTANFAEAMAAYWDERRTFLQSAFNVDSPRALDFAKTVDLTGRTAIVTGATSGIGYEVTKALAVSGAHVIGTSRTREGCVNLLRDMEEIYELNHVSCVKVDLGDALDIVKFGAQMEEHKFDLNLFVQAAGVYNDFPSVTEEGFDRAYAVNHLGHAMLTESLMPSILRAASKDELSRIISVNCGAHRFASFLPEQVNVDWIKRRRGMQAYAFSKWAQLAHAKFLADRFKKYGVATTVNSVNPGAFIDTKLGNRSFFHRNITRWANKFGIVKTPEQAAAEIVYLAIEPSLKRVTGKYYENYTITEPSELARDQSLVDYFSEETSSHIAHAFGGRNLTFVDGLYAFVMDLKRRQQENPVRPGSVHPEYLEDYVRMEKDNEKARYWRFVNRRRPPTRDQVGSLFPEGPTFKKGLVEQLVFSRERSSVSAYREVQLGLRELGQKQRSAQNTSS